MNIGEHIELMDSVAADVVVLKEMFPELCGWTDVDTWSSPVYKDGSKQVVIIWEGPNKHYRTTHSDYSVGSPWTTLEEVECYEYRDWRYRVISSKRYSDAAKK